ncbi:hypothetical protein L6452_02566 [Arctium lappa]|uniref:Uncharacterized protein n=1 Tax=Arctium lappa TaxID=4217 RepID=A0ACB9FLB1_ARCLA|nr:hypothetical protein L6452_02566 [Arctium lappa]
MNDPKQSPRIQASIIDHSPNPLCTLAGNNNNNNLLLFQSLLYPPSFLPIPLLNPTYTKTSNTPLLFFLYPREREREREINMFNLESPIVFLLWVLLTITISTTIAEPTIYQVLKSNGLPMGLLPKGVTNFTFDASGQFQVHLDEACNAKFEDELHYDRNVSGTLTYGQIAGLSGISAQDLFLWFPVKEIRVDVPSSGLIYFDVGVVSKQFSLSSFETPRDCLASPNHLIAQPKSLSRKLRIRKNFRQQHLMTSL